MKDQLIRYVDLLFAGAPDAGDIKQEILQNTLDRYDDLVAQGKSPEAAYSLAISGIGDINEILGSTEAPASTVKATPAEPARNFEPAAATPLWKKILRAAAIFLYIICPIPLFVLGEFGTGALGLCGTIAIVGVATALMVIAGGKSSPPGKADPEPATSTPQSELRKSVKTIITTIGLCVYFLLSFATQAWWITWLVFPIIAAVQGLVKACMDLKEARNQ